MKLTVLSLLLPGVLSFGYIPDTMMSEVEGCDVCGDLTVHTDQYMGSGCADTEGNWVGDTNGLPDGSGTGLGYDECVANGFTWSDYTCGESVEFWKTLGQNVDGLTEEMCAPTNAHWRDEVDYFGCCS